MPDPYQALVSVAAGLGLRQGEAFGLAVEDVDFLGGVVHVVRQVKLLQRHRPVFAPPKGGKERDVPLPEPVAFALAAHLKRHPLRRSPCRGRPSMAHRSQRRCSSRVPPPWPWIATASMTAWRSALRAVDVETGRDNGMHALRDFYASVLLDAGESVKALSEYLGHHDPGFTLRTNTHLMPSSETGTRAAVDGVCKDDEPADDGPETAQKGS
ncbi:tyrosine-type recombinase/integrase [Streptomyces sp. NPDC056479]|uniref:tyrosine-type recombinase/integrase n=1 Tax=Streptomyces sp. NPDC056479 TaxID=3345832 RepID=UPI0036BD2345